jgi:hypothetical protein
MAALELTKEQLRNLSDILDEAKEDYDPACQYYCNIIDLKSVVTDEIVRQRQLEASQSVYY